MQNYEVIKLAHTKFGNGASVATVRAKLPKYLLAELNTHRMKSSNAASSRAIPIMTVVNQVVENPFIPNFGKNQKGMQSTEALENHELTEALRIWNDARTDALKHAKDFNNLKVHKQFANRILEPWMWAEVILTMTDWNNFYALRCHEMAEPHFQIVANNIRNVVQNSVPDCSDWHIPYKLTPSEHRELLDELKVDRLTFNIVSEFLEENIDNFISEYYSEKRFNEFFLQDVAAGRLARVSVQRSEHPVKDILNDLRIAVQLSNNVPGHWSPFEHIVCEAKASDMRYEIAQLKVDYAGSIVPKEKELGYCGNLRGCKSYRKFFSNENIL